METVQFNIKNACSKRTESIFVPKRQKKTQTHTYTHTHIHKLLATFIFVLTRRNFIGFAVKQATIYRFLETEDILIRSNFTIKFNLLQTNQKPAYWILLRILIIFQQDATVFSLLHFCRQLYMFRVLTPIIRSWYNCNCSFWY